MRKFFAFAIIVSVLASCAGSKNDSTVKITGTIENAIPQGEVILEKFQIGEVTPVFTAYSDHNGNFEIETTIDGPGFYRLNIYGKQFETLILDGEDLKVEATGEVDGPINVTGSDDMQYINELYDYLGGYQEKVQDFNQRYIQARNSGDTQLVEDLTTEGLAMEAEKVKRLKEMAWNYESSLVSLLITDFIPNKTDEFLFLDSLSQKLQKELPSSKDVQFFSTQLENFRPAINVGDIAMDITLPNPDGEMMSLSDLRGKYVLLDFWAAWCGPCRRENPNVVNLYNKYKEDGFTVFSVSLDRGKDKWVEAIEKDGLVWPNHVSDLKYFQSEAAIQYKINAIPFALLLDPEGRVIGKNLRGQFLRDKLESIFGE
ncbi:redoxin domain-containing protein [Roseivirga pacifica]|uniref:redoxin domain-containing protein n=1 Tax=Roseivirga pacifica TaxID=1267423 RepID=UPI003BB03CB3